MSSPYSYVLLTSARNEGDYIEKTIQSVLLQTILPIRWVIISDGSTDDTDSIINKHIRAHAWIDLLHLNRQGGHDFGAKAYALNRAYEHLRAIDCAFVGILDADITVGPEYYRTMMDICHSNPSLGIVGGYVQEKIHGQWKNRPTNATHSVPGAVQFFRRECYERMGGFISSKVGGEDWYAEICVCMQGYAIRADPDIPVWHHKLTGVASGGLIRARYRSGILDYSIGSHPLFEIVKCLRRLPLETPYCIGSLVRLCGFAKAALCTDKRFASPDARQFLHAEQLRRLGIKKTKK